MLSIETLKPQLNISFLQRLQNPVNYNEIALVKLNKTEL